MVKSNSFLGKFGTYEYKLDSKSIVFSSHRRPKMVAVNGLDILAILKRVLLGSIAFFPFKSLYPNPSDQIIESL